MRESLLFALELLFVFCVIYAMITDYRRLHIPNMISIVLAAAFFPFALLAGPAFPLLPHVLIAGAVFAYSQQKPPLPPIDIGSC